MGNNSRNNWSPSMRILLLLIVALAGLILTSVFGIVANFAGTPMHTSVRIMVVMQDLLVFIAPAILTVMLCYKKPWQQMSLVTAPSRRALALVVVVCIVSIPACNWIVDWNEHIHLPASMAALEQSLRDIEDLAQDLTKGLMNDTSVWALVANLCVMGLLAGLSEEIFFRGGMLRLLKNDGNSHMAIWTVAIAFSAMHMQFFGFVPRVLLGVWFGYLVVWTRSLWVPIIAHALNNSMVVVMNYLANQGMIDANQFDKLGVPQDGSFPLMAIASAVATVAIIVAAKRCNLLKTE